MDRNFKAWFVYGGSPGWYSCTMILSNGWAPFGHLCSHPNFAPGDLWIGRKERMEAFAKMGITLDIQPGIYKEVDFLNSNPDIYEKHQNKENWEALSSEYETTEKTITARSMEQKEIGK